MRTVPVHRSIHRRILVLGAERDLVQFAGFIAFLLAFGGMTMVSCICAGVFWFVALNVLQRMGKADQHMSQVFTRHVNHREFYPARSTPWRMQ